MTHDFTVFAVIPATPRAIYDAWLDGASHSKMTGGRAEASPSTGASFTAWDGYITGANLELIPGECIVQSWRSSDFAEADEDSQITVTLETIAGGTKVTLTHSGVPEGQPDYKSGWHENYFEPTKAYFAKAKAH